MDHNIALYNSRIIQVYLEYTSKNYSAVNIDFILENAKITKFEVEDPACWFSQAQVDSFYEGLVENTKNTNIAREAGRYIVFSGVTGGLRQYTLGLLNLTTIFSLMDKLYSLMSRASTITTKKLGPNMVEVIATPKHGVNEKLYQCENRLGSFESLPRLFTSKYAKVEHPLCFHKGDECCRYIISWEIPPSMLRKRIRNYLLALGIPASAILLIVMPIVAWIIFFLVLTCLALCFSFYCEYLQRMELYRIVQNQGDAAEDLFEEIKIRHNNATLVKEIGQATSSILDISELVSAIAQTMDKHLDFDRGLIMLAGEDKSRLVYADGFGYSDDQEEVLRQTEFHLDNPESKGILVRAFKEQRPLLVNDIIENKNDLSKRSLELAKQMNVQSLVCVPIVYEKESIGIIAVDNLMSKRPLTQSDISLLSGVASQTAVSIVNSRAFQRLHQSEQKYRELVENANSIILRLDFNGNITFFNEFAQGFFGFSEKEVLGMNLEDTISPGDKSARVKLALLIDTLRQKPEEHLIRESENTLKYGKTVWIVWTYKPTFDNQGNFKEILCIGNDITQNKRSEKETRILQDQLQRAQKMEALGTLAGGVAHDLNNILSGIISYPELLLMDLSEDSALRKPILTIKNSGERAAAIVSDLLTMARGAIAITEVVNLNGVLHEYLKSPEHARLRSDNPRIEFETRLDATLLNVLGSPVHLSKVVMNLINNAAEAMPDGGRALIATENQYVDRPMKGYDFVRAGDYSTLSVTDTGIGISPKDLERIFEPFYTRKVMGKSGTGLGLAVIWGTVKDHNGYIEVQSKVGEGTIFTLFFPVTREVLSEEKMVTSMKKYEGHGETILIVDDMPEQREIASEMLKKLGYLVASAPSGEEALDYLRKNSADLIVLDMIMGPGMDGLETYKRIVELIPGQKAIIASGFSETKRVKEAQKIGVGAYVKKPYLLEKIGMAVRRELDQ